MPADATFVDIETVKFMGEQRYFGDVYINLPGMRLYSMKMHGTWADEDDPHFYTGEHEEIKPVGVTFIVEDEEDEVFSFYPVREPRGITLSEVQGMST